MPLDWILPTPTNNVIHELREEDVPFIHSFIWSRHGIMEMYPWIIKFFLKGKKDIWWNTWLTFLLSWHNGKVSMNHILKKKKAKRISDQNLSLTFLLSTRSYGSSIIVCAWGSNLGMKFLRCFSFQWNASKYLNYVTQHPPVHHRPLETCYDSGCEWATTSSTTKSRANPSTSTWHYYLGNNKPTYISK